MLFQLSCRHCHKPVLCPFPDMYGYFDVHCILELCDHCENLPYIVEESLKDGAEKISARQASMWEGNWRQHFIRYQDCVHCGGHGWMWRHQQRYQCLICQQKYNNHPVRKKYLRRINLLTARAMNLMRQNGEINADVIVNTRLHVGKLKAEMESLV